MPREQWRRNLWTQGLCTPWRTSFFSLFHVHFIYSYLSEPEYYKSVWPAQLSRSGWKWASSADLPGGLGSIGCLWFNSKGDQSCYQLRPDQPSGWQALVAGQLINHHCPSPQTTRNHFLREVDWFLIGEEEEEDGRLCGGGIGATISTELLTSPLQWTKQPIDLPY